MSADGERWKTVAAVLAERLEHHAYCPKHQRVVAGCPFCEDIAAFETYLSAGGERRISIESGPSVSLVELWAAGRLPAVPAEPRDA